MPGKAYSRPDSALNERSGPETRLERDPSRSHRSAPQVSCLFDPEFQRVVDLGSPTERLGEGRRADRGDHELLHVHVVSACARRSGCSSSGPAVRARWTRRGSGTAAARWSPRPPGLVARVWMGRAQAPVADGRRPDCRRGDVYLGSDQLSQVSLPDGTAPRYIGLHVTKANGAFIAPEATPSPHAHQTPRDPRTTTRLRHSGLPRYHWAGEEPGLLVRPHAGESIVKVDQVPRIVGALLFQPTPHMDERGFFFSHL